MNCKVCNTRLSTTARSCPNCGSDAPAEAAFSRSSKPTPLPSPELSTARDDEDDMVVELEDLTEDDAPAPPPPAPPRPRPPPAPRTAAPRPSGNAPLFAPDAAGLRALLREQPEALEQGLGVFRNEQGAAVGAGYASAVGEIDLLATDAEGQLVVVMIAEKGEGEELVGQVLQRIGWVRKHVGGGKKSVRGIVLCEEPPESLGYTAAAVADTIRFKTYRVALTFQDVEL